MTCLAPAPGKWGKNNRFIFPFTNDYLHKELPGQVRCPAPGLWAIWIMSLLSQRSIPVLIQDLSVQTLQGRKERLVQDTLDQEQDNRQELRPEDKQEHKKDEKGCLQKRGPPTPTPKYTYLVCSYQRLHSKVIFNKLFSFTRCLGQAMALKKRCLSFQLSW